MSHERKGGMNGIHKGAAGVTILLPGLSYSLKNCWSNTSLTHLSCSQITAITIKDQEVSRIPLSGIIIADISPHKTIITDRIHRISTTSKPDGRPIPIPSP
jgi:hypothetical protein